MNKMKYKIFNENCITGSRKHIKDKSVDLVICDPPFGINETKFDNHYNRQKENITTGYVEAPKNYSEFSKQWISEAKRILKDNGSMYIISGWSKLSDILNAVDKLDLHVINHIIWKFNFGVFTKKKFVTSHYHILYVSKKENADLTFNRFCRFGPNEKDEQNKSMLYKDLEDVWMINKEFHHGTEKNQNKLPEELIKKIILYSSNKKDIVCDFFMGNFTTAVVAIKYGRIPIGFEMNKCSFDINFQKINNIKFGVGLESLKTVEIDLPKNQGKPLENKEIKQICKEYNTLISQKSCKDTISELSFKYQRGMFSIKNIIKKYNKVDKFPKKKSKKLGYKEALFD